MQSLAELLDPDDAGAEKVRHLLAYAVNPVEVVRGTRSRGELALLRVQASTSTPLGTVAYRLGGLIFDHGWLRILGGGSPRLPRDLVSWNGPAEAPRLGGAVLVADDVIGGFFAANAGAFEGANGSIHYFAPDTLAWENLDIDYRDLLEWASNGDLDSFYSDTRWSGWEREVLSLRVDQGLRFDPPLSVDAPHRERATVLLEELFAARSLETRGLGRRGRRL